MVPPLPDAPKGERAYTPCDPSITENALAAALRRERAVEEPFSQLEVAPTSRRLDRPSIHII
jgi:hypothetical protein